MALTFVVRGLDVEPSQVTLDGGDSQQFTATLFGQPANITSGGIPSIACIFGTTYQPHCARLTVREQGNGLRLGYCNGLESQCDGSAISRSCALLFDATPTSGGFTGTGVNNNPPCCIGCIGQNRAYGCTINATLTVDPGGQQTLEGDFGGTVTSCSADQSSILSTHFKFCRPDPCPVPPPHSPSPD